MCNIRVISLLEPSRLGILLDTQILADFVILQPLDQFAPSQVL